MLLKHGKILVDNQQIATDILIQDGIIVEMGADIVVNNEETIDCTGKLLVPGFIDVHVHLREPGGEHKETIETGTFAAARGGFTTVCSMPNTNPVPDNVEVFERLKSRISETAHVKVYPYASITTNLKGNQLVDFTALKNAGAFAFTDDGVGVQSADQMLQAMRGAAAVGLPIVAHTEENSLLHGGVVHQGEVSERLGVPGLTSLTESVQIARDVLLAEAANCHYHVCHVSAKESVRVIRDAKKAGIKVTAEVSPHHLVLDETHVKTADSNFKMNPPLRGVDDRQALIEGLLDGTLDMIATDHAPHAQNEKERGIIDAPFGIVGSENAFQLLYTKFVQSGVFTLQQLVDWLTIKPAEVFGFNTGKLAVGKPADITVIDLNKTYTLRSEDFYSKSRNTPFEGEVFNADIVLTLVDGRIAYQA